MNRRLVTLVAAAVFALVAPLTLNAQTIYVMGGVTSPTGDYGDFTDTGWMGSAGALFDIGPPGLSVGADAFYGQNSFKDGTESSDDPKLYGGMGLVQYSFQTGTSIQPYIYGGAGILVLKVGDESESGLGYQVGGGVGYPVSPTVSIFGDVRYMGGSPGDIDVDVTLFGVSAGVAFGLGG
jgi:opacity protein-like surface antigen